MFRQEPVGYKSKGYMLEHRHELIYAISISIKTFSKHRRQIKERDSGGLDEITFYIWHL